MERIRLVGFLKLKVEGSGGGARVGVSGAGVGFAAGACRFRACNFGRRFRRSSAAIDGSCSLSFERLSKADGILTLIMVVG